MKDAMKPVASSRGLQRLRRYLGARDAVSALEYAILISVVVVAISTALQLFRDQLVTALRTAGSIIPTLPGISG